MSDKSVIIIGAGIAGLSAGCYARMNGYTTKIFEMHNKPGGLCTSWKRKGYTIDGCIHWLVGSSPGSPFYRLWEEVGAVQGQRIIDHKEFGRVEGKNGQVFIMYTDIGKLEQHMRSIAPEDSAVIADFVKGLRDATRFSMPLDKPPELYNVFDISRAIFKMTPRTGFMRKWGSISIQEFSKRFQNPFLRETLPLFFDLPDFPMMAMLMTLAWMHQKVAGYPVGGSLAFSRAIEKRYLDLGGEIHYKSRVAKILVEDNEAAGVKLVDGTEHRSDFVISAADGHATIFDMLDGKYVDDTVNGYYEKLPVFPCLIFIGIGTYRSFDDVPSDISAINFPMKSPLTIAGQRIERLTARIHNFDPTLAPEGKTVLTVFFGTVYDYWKELRKNIDVYTSEKEEIAKKIIEALDVRFPGLADKVEMYDVSTPVTFERYTGNWQGSYEGWLVTTKKLQLQMKKTLPGLDNFYMAGQWIAPGGGLPTSVMTGRHVVQMLCHKDRKRFITTVPS
jgi:phytoene dehydrogenase-like protein